MGKTITGRKLKDVNWGDEDMVVTYSVYVTE